MYYKETDMDYLEESIQVTKKAIELAKDAGYPTDKLEENLKTLKEIKNPKVFSESADK